MKTIGILLLMALSLGVTALAWADIVEMIDGHVYKGTITKMDENEIVIKTTTGTAHVPRSKVRSFQSDLPPTTSSPSGNAVPSQPPATQKEPSSVLGESAKEAIRALKKLQARCQAGISYRDYGPALGEAKFEVNLFLESPEAKRKTELAESIQRAMSHYEFAGVVWHYVFADGRMHLIFSYTEFGKTILGLYPNANRYIENGGALIYDPKTDPNNPKFDPVFVRGSCIISDSTLLSIIWAEGSKELEKATRLHSQN